MEKTMLMKKIILGMSIFAISTAVFSLACDDSGDNDSGTDNGGDSDVDADGDGDTDADSYLLPFVRYTFREKTGLRTTESQQTVSSDEFTFSDDVLMEKWGTIECSPDGNRVLLRYTNEDDNLCRPRWGINIDSTIYSGPGQYSLDATCNAYDDFVEADTVYANIFVVTYRLLDDGTCPTSFEWLDNWDFYSNDDHCKEEHSDKQDTLSYSWKCDINISEHTTNSIRGSFSCEGDWDLYEYTYETDGTSGVVTTYTEKRSLEMSGEFGYDPATCSATE
jgi:hypothetical protein